MQRLHADFFNQPTLDIARMLPGKIMISATSGRKARIVEVEAYHQHGDPAAHSARGLTNRNKVMFGPPGHLYVYFIYGMHFCANIVTEGENTGAAVLLRAAEPLAGFKNKDPLLLSGPGRLARAFRLDRSANGRSLLQGNFYLADDGKTQGSVLASSRIGISAGKELLWRFYLAESLAVSNRTKKARLADLELVKRRAIQPVQ